MFCFDPIIGWPTIAQFIGFVVVILTVIYQMKEQRSLQRAKHRTDLQQKTYEK